MAAVTYDDAVAALYQAPLAAFVAERKRLAAELKAAGAKDEAARVAKLGKPSQSAWAVNQLHWRARPELDAMFATAERLRAGELAATAAHREAQAALRARAAALIAEGGSAATEAVLRRIMTTLAALAAAGGFAPDPPGALVEDRDPPGFEAAGIPAGEPAPRAPVAAAPVHDELAAKRRELERLAAERHRAAEAKRRAAEREQIVAALATARAEVWGKDRAVRDAQLALAAAETAAAKARTIADDLEARLAALPPPSAP